MAEARCTMAKRIRCASRGFYLSIRTVPVRRGGKKERHGAVRATPHAGGSVYIFSTRRRFLLGACVRWGVASPGGEPFSCLRLIEREATWRPDELENQQKTWKLEKARYRGSSRRRRCCEAEGKAARHGMLPPAASIAQYAACSPRLPASPGPHRRVALSHPHNWWRNPSAVLCPRDEERGIRGSRRLLGRSGRHIVAVGEGYWGQSGYLAAASHSDAAINLAAGRDWREEAQCRIQARRSNRPEA